MDVADIAAAHGEWIGPLDRAGVPRSWPRVSRVARAHLADCAVVGLDAVLEQEATYARDGFVTAHGTTRYALESPSDLTGPTPDGIVIGDVVGVATEDLVDYEVTGRMFPTRRPSFLEAWCAMPSAVGRIARDDAGRIRGWGLRRRCVAGHKVGPLFADEPEVADWLWRSLVTGADGPVFLDVPEPNAAAQAMVGRFGMTPVFSTRRMYAGGDPGLALARVFGVTTLELG